MKKIVCALAMAALAGCAGSGESSWVALVDNGKGLENFDRFREANWEVKDGAIQADRGGKDPAYLVTRKSYSDFEIRVEFWASHDANSGVFVRCQDPKNIGDENCYEANIFDQRPDPSQGTGGIVKVASLQKPYPQAGGKWNVMEVVARGDRLTVVFNGQTTVDVIATRKHMSGPIALQWGRGVIKFRKVEIREL
jgi:hypothetical protein